MINKKQCDLLSIDRSWLYYRLKQTSKLNQELMHLMDEQYLQKQPCGVYRMWEWLRKKDNGYKDNSKCNESGDSAASWGWRQSDLNLFKTARSRTRWMPHGFPKFSMNL